MDESWRMRMGMPSPPPAPTSTRPKLPTYPARRSTEDATSHRRKPISDDPLDPEDFTDVFGGPPHTVLSRQFSTTGLPRSSSTTSYFYQEIFQPPEKTSTVVRRSGRSLPAFRIPGQHRGPHELNHRNRESYSFYGDIFGCDDERMVRSRSRSKASSSSVLSSEELSPLRPAISGDDNDDVSLFASKLRPINVKSRWNQMNQEKSPLFSGSSQSIYNATEENGCSLENLRNYPYGMSRRNTSPETISLEPISNGSFRVSPDDRAVESPLSSAVSSVCHSDQEGKAGEIEEEILRQDHMDEDEDETMSSYVIEINSDIKEGTMSESNGVDEAIAWAKEKFQTYCSESSKWSGQESANMKQEIVNAHQLSEGLADSFESQDEQHDQWATEEEIDQFGMKVETERQILDEKLRLWSTGKETDIRLLLSSLHHILWPNSGWSAVPLANIIEGSHVKKAYQKARLCLHPDKLQQRGATIEEKYIAERAFSVLQDAWAAFISRDVFCR